MKIHMMGTLSFKIALLLMGLSFCGKAVAQEKRQVVRVARLVIDSTQLENYKALLKEGVEIALRVEPGVLTLFAVSEKEHPTHFTILEIYADSTAYRAHLQTPHFIHYKTATKDMVKSLELIETVPLIPSMKIK